MTETEQLTNTLHKHHKEIIAWANGAIIQSRLEGSNKSWFTCNPSWSLDNEYRVLPEKRKDIVKYCIANNSSVGCLSSNNFYDDNLKLTFDGETAKLISAEVI